MSHSNSILYPLRKIVKKAGPLAKEYGRFLSWQILIILLNTVSGFIIIRALSKVDYAYYTIAFSTLSIFTTITNTGIDPALNSIGGRVWKDPVKTGALVGTALTFRKKIGLFCMIPVMGYGIWQLSVNHASAWSIFLFAAGWIIGGNVQIQSGIYNSILRLNNKIKTLQWAELLAAAIKLAGILILWKMSPNPYYFLWCVVFAFALQLLLIRPGFRSLVSGITTYDIKIAKQIRDLFKPNILNTIYWSFQGQILIFICTLFGTTENIGEIGAMGRIVLLLSPFSLLIANYFQPAIAKAASPGEVRNFVVRALVILLIPSSILLSFTYFKPEPILWILGQHYGNLRYYLSFYLMISLINIFQTVISGFCVARGWVKLYFLYTPVILTAQILLMLTLNIRNMYDILAFQGIIELITLLLMAAFFLHGYSHFKKNPLVLND